ncbi:MAG: glucose-1-phosphate adenylyltransferase subunit GlgD [Oscillospiraceae bacterium]|nr:glucose-1-phosphate adenylyltransferase subunit GlgD [Oscillospiraceae bacterium]
MRGKNVVGLIFANVDEGTLNDITGIRSVASVPFGGGYRLVDFTLSNMVNAGMGKVGVITNSNYQSLMDHIGSGKPWDLARKNDGLYLLPPFNSEAISNYNMGELGALKNVMNFLAKSGEEYVFMSTCSYVANLDLKDVFDFHEKSGADITLLSVEGRIPQFENQPVIEETENGRITKLRLATPDDTNGKYILRASLMKKALLERLAREAFSTGETSFEKGILLKNLNRFKFCEYKLPGFTAVMDSLDSYFKANFALLDRNNFDSLFPASRPVYTKTYEDMPAVYGLGSDVRSSLIADGCIIDGEVENCILFRGCRIEKDAVIKNSILMPNCFVGEAATMNYVIADKSVSIRSRRSISGADTYPVYIGKEIQI